MDRPNHMSPLATKKYVYEGLATLTIGIGVLIGVMFGLQMVWNHDFQRRQDSNAAHDRRAVGLASDRADALQKDLSDVRIELRDLRLQFLKHRIGLVEAPIWHENPGPDRSIHSPWTRHEIGWNPPIPIVEEGRMGPDGAALVDVDRDGDLDFVPDWGRTMNLVMKDAAR